MDPLILDLTQLSVEKQKPNSVQISNNNELKVTSFEDLLSSSMKEVNSLQLESDAMVRKLAVGDVEDISEVVLASSRAEIALKMFMELRNKFVDAYQLLSRMSG